MATGTIEFELVSGIEYVAGTINGVETVFVQDTANPVKWRATVEVAKDDLYHIYLEMHDEAGNVSYYENTIEYILPWFVFDRTKEDVERVMELRKKGWENFSEEEKAEWIAGMKGCLNKLDLKRNENNIAIIARLLKVDVTTYQGRIPELPDRAYFDNLLGNVQLLRTAGYVRADTPKVPAQPINTYQKLNDIEQILYDIYSAYNTNFGYYCGNEIYCGDEVGFLL